MLSTYILLHFDFIPRKQTVLYRSILPPFSWTSTKKVFWIVQISSIWCQITDIDEIGYLYWPELFGAYFTQVIYIQFIFWKNICTIHTNIHVAFKVWNHWKIFLVLGSKIFLEIRLYESKLYNSKNYMSRKIIWVEIYEMLLSCLN